MITYTESADGKSFRIHIEGKSFGRLMYSDGRLLSEVGWQYVPDGSRLSASKVFATLKEAKRFVEE